MADLFLMLIKINAELKNDPKLADRIEEIEAEYMKKYESLGRSIAHVALEGPWDFALLFPGSRESVMDLERSIRSSAPQVQSVEELLTMPATELDDFVRSLRSRA